MAYLVKNEAAYRVTSPVLKKTGIIVPALHCDSTMSHYSKACMTQLSRAERTMQPSTLAGKTLIATVTQRAILTGDLLFRQDSSEHI
jgi:hypothetical protein